jgi:serine/threonine protein kinase/DNA-binding CsgD family transcriptional regulator
MRLLHDKPKGMSPPPVSFYNPPPVLNNRYRLVQQLGKGGMGVVYRAHDEMLARDVAIKFIAPERMQDDEARERFLREARAVARLSHPNIMTLYDVAHDEAWHYLVLEHIAGRTLRAGLHEHSVLNVDESLDVMRGTLRALAYAHAQGIIHRDIKPENIMLTPEGQVKVTDFGLALAQGDVRLTQEGSLSGTVSYMSPEVITGETPTARSDLYAVGVVWYELLTGRLPFEGNDTLTMLANILHSPVTAPRIVMPSIPTDIERIILTLIAKDPDARYASAEATLAALPDTPATSKASATISAATPHEPQTLLERIIHTSSTTTPKPTPEAADDAPLLMLPTEPIATRLTQELLLYVASEDLATVIEAERKRLANLLQNQLADPLNLLLSQANAYEQSLGAHPTARMAVSVLATLARQLLQQLRDLEANLHPSTLESLGLEPALEAFAGQVMRASGATIMLALERMRERLPAPIELALFRLTQDALNRAIQQGHATQLTIRFERRDEQIRFSIGDNGTGDEGVALLRAACQRIEQLGGKVDMGTRKSGGFELAVRFTVTAPPMLTAREMEVLQLLAEGLSNKEIAKRLSVTPRTVNFHLDNIYSKLGVSSRTEAAMMAMRLGWIKRS